MFTLLGYMIMFMIENIFFNSHAILHSVMEGSGHSHGHGHDHGQDNLCSLDHGHSGHEHSPVLSVSVNSSPSTIAAHPSANIRKPVLSANSAIALLFAMAVHR